MEINFVILNILLDSRRSAVDYLQTMKANEKIQHGDKVIEHYKQVVDLLKTLQENVFKTPASDPEKQMEEIIKGQIKVLFQVSEIEKEAIHLIEKALIERSDLSTGR